MCLSLTAGKQGLGRDSGCGVYTLLRRRCGPLRSKQKNKSKGSITSTWVRSLSPAFATTAVLPGNKSERSRTYSGSPAAHGGSAATGDTAARRHSRRSPVPTSSGGGALASHSGLHGNQHGRVSRVGRLGRQLWEARPRGLC